MALTLNKPYLGLRASLSGDAVVFLPREGICDGIVLNTPYIGLRAGVSGDAVVFLISDQQLTMGDKLVIGKPYIALRAAVDGGSLVYLVDGLQCEPDPYCCEYVFDPAPSGLTATVSVSGMFFSPFTVTLYKQSQPPGTASCYQNWEGLVAYDGLDGSYTVSIRLSCQLAPKCNEWHVNFTIGEVEYGTPNVSRAVYGTEPMSLITDSPVLFDTLTATAATPPGMFDPLNDCCADVPGWPGPAEYGCGTFSTNIVGATVTMDISE